MRIVRLKGLKTRDVVIKSAISSTIDVTGMTSVTKGARRVEAEAARSGARTSHRSATRVTKSAVRTVKPAPSKVTESLAEVSKTLGLTYVKHDGRALVTMAPGHDVIVRPAGAAKGVPLSTLLTEQATRPRE